MTSRFLLWTLREPQRALTNWRHLLRPDGVLAVVDGIWGGFRRDDERMTETWKEFLSAYDERVVAALPLSEAETPEVSAAAVREAGFTDVRVTWLTEIEAIERRETGSEDLSHICDRSSDPAASARHTATPTQLPDSHPPG